MNTYQNPNPYPANVAIRIQPYSRFVETAETQNREHRTARASLEMFCQDDLKAHNFKTWEIRNNGVYQGVVVYDKNMNLIGTFGDFLTAHKKLCTNAKSKH